MKLLERYNRLNITATILTFLIGSCTFYFLLDYVLLNQLDETLQTEQQEIATYVSTHHSMPEIIRTKDQYTSYEVVSTPLKTAFLTVKNKENKEEEDLREIQFTVEADGKYLLVKVDKPLEETESLLKVIIGVTIAMIGLILLTGYLINRIVIRRLWQPFYKTIDRVKSYHLADQDTLQLERVSIDEFALLNQSINEMTERIQQDYGSLKNFTGQAAHEMQTPLAIIRTRLDTLMQHESVLANDARSIMDIERAVHRLSRLNQSLLLLTKVENRQFVLNTDIRLDSIIEDKWAELTELAETMQLTSSISLQPVQLLFHQQLAEIIISNLINNAIRYNKTEGAIEINLSARQFSISNTSQAAGLDKTKLFKRFYRASSPEEGNGLGLSIVKQICDMAGYVISYEYREGRHSFSIDFGL